MRQAALDFTGTQLKKIGTDRVLSHNETYKELFHVTASALLATKSVITSEDVIAVIGMPAGHPNAVGAAMGSFAKKNKLVVLRYIKATRPTCHAAVIAEWGRRDTL